MQFSANVVHGYGRKHSRLFFILFFFSHDYRMVDGAKLNNISFEIDLHLMESERKTLCKYINDFH